MRTNTKAFLIGLLGYAALCVIRHGYENEWITRQTLGLDKNWHVFVSTALTALLLIAPPYLSGRFCLDKGALIGLLVVFFGFTLRFLILSEKWKSLPPDWPLLRLWLQQMLIPVCVGAVSGAAGQLHKSSLKGSRRL